MNFLVSFLARWIRAATDPPPPTIAADTPDDVADTFEGPLDSIPSGRRESREIYGVPGHGQLNKKWARENMHTAKGLPGIWNRRSGKIYCHNLAEPYIREALRRCEVAGVLDQIQRLGCFNFRHQRHDSSRPLSYHAFGIALDLNSRDNSVKRYRRGEAPEPWSDEWMRVWPNGVSRELVDIFESLGFSWGGRWQTFCDPMHFQLVT
jgi:hypothetical protein